MSTMNRETSSIENAYVAVELKNGGALHGLRDGLLETLKAQGLACENAAPKVHVSIAYGQGRVAERSLTRALGEIARHGFEVEATGFEIFEGRQTEHDYLVVTLTSRRGDLEEAMSAVKNCMPIRSFEGGFKTHVSLLRFAKGSRTASELRQLVRELNASFLAASALGRSLSFEGECVCAFTPERHCCLQVALEPQKAA